MKKNKRVLFTTKYQENNVPHDFFRQYTPKNLKISLSNTKEMQSSLRFIKQNLPQIEIMEFPTWETYTQVINQGWDIVGFSFYTYETEIILQMAEYARKAGVSEIWAGNYGALNPLIESNFDKIFTGYSEEKISKELGIETKEFIHPPIIDTYGLNPLGGPFMLSGWLYTARGCPLKCTYCQTPAFADTVVKTPIESIDRVLHYYKNHGIKNIYIFDENFGIDPKHSQEVVSLLKDYDIPWGAMTRADILKKNFDEWYESGLHGVMIGIESMRPQTLKDIKKQEKIDIIIEILEMLNNHNCYTIGSYMIGYDTDNVESVKRDFQELKKLKPDFMKLFIITPFPKTKLWDQLQNNYGIDTSDWSKFDGKNLVWNHPLLTGQDCHNLLEYGYELFNSEEHVANFLSKRLHRTKDMKGLWGVHDFFASTIFTKMHGKIENPLYF